MATVGSTDTVESRSAREDAIARLRGLKGEPRDQPISLADVCAEIFGGSITPSTLKAEQRRGNLVVSKIGRKYFTTRAHVEAMIEKCRVPHRPLAVKTDRRTELNPEASLAAAWATVERLKAAGRKSRQL